MYTQINSYLYHEWLERIQEDEVFDDNTKPEDWHINEKNCLEFIEALNLDNSLGYDDLVKIIHEHPSGKDEKGHLFILYHDLVSHLAHLLLEDKKISFESLINIDCSVPVDRITKFLKMMQRELMSKKVRN
jgi:hypothetical protein